MNSQSMSGLENDFFGLDGGGDYGVFVFVLKTKYKNLTFWIQTTCGMTENANIRVTFLANVLFL